MAEVQIFARWEPFTLALPPLELLGLVDMGEEDFRLILRAARDPLLRFSLRWTRRPHAYRNVDESYRLRLWDGFQTGGHPFWVVRESEWLREFHTESLDVYANASLVHYGIYTDDDCVDVISAEPPVAEVVAG